MALIHFAGEGGGITAQPGKSEAYSGNRRGGHGPHIQNENGDERGRLPSPP